MVTMVVVGVALQVAVVIGTVVWRVSLAGQSRLSSACVYLELIGCVQA